VKKRVWVLNQKVTENYESLKNKKKNALRKSESYRNGVEGGGDGRRKEGGESPQSLSPAWRFEGDQSGKKNHQNISSLQEQRGGEEGIIQICESQM